MQSVRSRYPVTAIVQCRDGTDDQVRLFETVATAYEYLSWIPGDVLALYIDLSGSETPAEYLGGLFDLNMCNMKELYLGADPPADDFSHIFNATSTTQQWPVEYSPDGDIDPQDYIRYYVKPSFEYEHFLNGLQLWTALERIEARYFLHIPTADEGHIPAMSLDPCEWTLASHHNLESFIVEDVPYRVQFLLGYLYIPVQVDVHLTATSITRTFEADMVEEMVYSHAEGTLRGVRMLDEAAHIRVKVRSTSLLVCAELSPDEEDQRRFILEARPAFESASNPESRAVRGCFLQRLLYALPRTFVPSRVSCLRIDGDVTWISNKDDWVNLLQPFHNLETLQVDDYANGRSGTVSAMCEGLAVETYNAWRRLEAPICPRLTRLHIRNVEFSIRSGVECVYKLLKDRKRRGYAIVHCVCELQVRGRVTASKWEETMSKLSTVVKDLVLLALNRTADKLQPQVPPKRPLRAVRLLLPEASK